MKFNDISLNISRKEFNLFSMISQLIYFDDSFIFQTPMWTWRATWDWRIPRVGGGCTVAPCAPSRASWSTTSLGILRICTFLDALSTAVRNTNNILLWLIAVTPQEAILVGRGSQHRPFPLLILVIKRKSNFLGWSFLSV